MSRRAQRDTSFDVRRGWLPNSPGITETAQLPPDRLRRFGVWAVSVIGAGKAWAYDPVWVESLAREPRRLVPLLMQLGAAPPVFRLSVPLWWYSVPAEVALVRRAHGLRGGPTCIGCRTRPGAWRVLVVHQPTGQWMDCEDGANGPSVLSLVQHRRGVSQAKAAWWVAKRLGFPKPLPPPDEAIPE